MSIPRALALAALILTSVSTASATTTYGSQAALEASMPGLTFETVNLASLVCSPCASITDPLTGIIFSTPSPVLTVLNATTIHVVGSGSLLTVALPSSILAFGASLTISSGGVTAQFTGDSPNPNYSNFFTASPSYLGGRVVAGPITGLSYQLTGGPFDLVGFEAASGGVEPPPTVPETATLISMAGGLILISAIKRRAQSPRSECLRPLTSGTRV